MEGNDNSRLKWRRRGVVAGWVVGGAAFGLIGLSFPFVLPALRRYCLPYVPATPIQVERVLSVLEGRRGTVVDLGSGDGRVVIAAAQRGHHAVGYELNPWLVAYSWVRALVYRVPHRAKFYCRNLWKVDLSKYENVVVFGVEEMMIPLGEKIAREVSASGRVVACRFPFPQWEATTHFSMGPHSVWVYDNVAA